jgi:predicted secreted protein
LSGVRRLGDDWSVAQRYCGEAGILFYPCPEKETVFPSVRWELVRDGIEDWEILKTIKDNLKSLNSTLEY